MRYILLLTGLLFFYGSIALANHPKTFYVSHSAVIGNEGTKSHPFGSLKEAQQAIRFYRTTEDYKLHPRNIIVWLRGGIYELSEGFNLTEKDSGSKESSTTYQAYPGEKVVITGGKVLPFNNVYPITNSRERSRIIGQSVVNKIKVIDLKTCNLFDYGKYRITGFRRPYVNASMELFINGNPYHLARFPNEKQIKIAAEDILDSGLISDHFYPGCICFDKKKLALWKEAHDVFVCGNFKYAWATDQLRVQEMDSISGKVKFADAHMFGISGGKKWNQYFYFNLLEEIDAPGEYYIDHQKGLLYFYPLEELKPSDTIMVSTLDEALVSLKRASYIRFKNLSFEVGRGIGIYMENTISNKVENCTISNMGIVGICIGKGSKPSLRYGHPNEMHPFYPKEKLSGGIGSLYEELYENPIFNREGGKGNGVINCIIKNTGCGGVSIGGGNRLTLERGDNYLYNCEFTNCGRLDYSYKAPVNIDGVGNEIRHCKFNSCPATAIYVHGNNHIIEYNVIDGACKFMDDQGAVYIGRDPSELGNIVRYNFFKDIGTFGITVGVYLDDGACGSQIYGNVFYKAGSINILIGGGCYNKIENNLFIESELALHLDNRLQNWAKNFLQPGGTFELRLKAVNYQNPPFSVQYPEMVSYFENNPSLPQYNVIKNNIFFKVKQVCNEKKVCDSIGGENLVIDQSLGFKDSIKLDFSLKKNSIVFHKMSGFKAVPFKKIGRLY
ncbi:MAG: right-handed parallel beta-helix repeat-containing protein [Bacteroides sp.]|jgi:parallel beta-helix repeat protein|nr:right-handed parallel beta-helix repeat-containing protein [Bacteroides sp.]